MAFRPGKKFEVKKPVQPVQNGINEKRAERGLKDN
jgi:hypothetical protein